MSTPKVYVLIDDVRKLPQSFKLSVMLIDSEVEIFVEYDRVSNYFIVYQGLDYMDDQHLNQTTKKKTVGTKST